MKCTDFFGKEKIFCDGLRVGKIKDVLIDGEEWKIIPLEVELRKEAAQEVLGVKFSFKNLLAISAVDPVSKSPSKRPRITSGLKRPTTHIPKNTIAPHLVPSYGLTNRNVSGKTQTLKCQFARRVIIIVFAL